VILVTVGSQLPFDRLIAPVAVWARARGVKDIYFQHGGTAVDLSGFDHAAFVPPDEAARLFDRATAVVAHVGMGTILGCLERGKPILVLPRKASLGETRNEHQSASARSLEGRPGFVVAWDERELPVLLDRLDSMQGGERIASDASPELLTAVRAFVHGTRLPRG
jgi:UDP-N-acetylglucosamine transferase subunit ALG13